MTATTATTTTEPWATTEFGLTLHDTGADGDRRVTELVRPGLRRNPRRAHLLVSTVLGKHLPTDPGRVRAAADTLADEVVAVLGDAATDAVVLGFAETATGLGHAVAARMRAACYLHSTRRATAGVPVLGGFEEGHSHATSHLLQPTSPELFTGAAPLVLVDDEISTGATAVDAIRALHRIAPRDRYVVASLVDMREAHHRAEIDAAATALGARIDHVALAAGRTELPDGLTTRVTALDPPVLNPVAATAGTVTVVPVGWPADVPDGGRYGILAADSATFAAATAAAAAALEPHLDPGRPVIVIGHEELMYLPLCIAEHLARQGTAVRYQTTTRSPAYVHDDPGYPLRRGFEFHAPEPDGAARRYLYNAAWPEPAAEEQLLLVIDSPADTPELRSPGGLLDVLTAAGHDVVVAVVPATDHHALTAARNARKQS
ncbi:phosphoribosyltransferase family protein [Prescottella sp. R16]|uniref:phosphoribosyltransferase family protein n=1 Tax=Prescottella sp. R16 TaxID=3064529 RepID=UPI00272E15F6|nr:phosphoribosyltransferase family protein [Prescottella sp. R16]